MLHLRVPPGLGPAQTVPAEPQGLAHGENGILKSGLPAAQADGAAEISEHVPLLLDLPLDLGKALLHGHGPVGGHAQHDGDALLPHGGGIDVCQGPQLPPYDLQGVPENDLTAVRGLLAGAGQVHPGTSAAKQMPSAV